jgi:hypothetical protein
VETRRRLGDEQERMRLNGLRILARIIARHARAHPDRYGGAGPAPRNGGVDAGGPPDRTDDAA